MCSFCVVCQHALMQDDSLMWSSLHIYSFSVRIRKEGVKLTFRDCKRVTKRRGKRRRVLVSGEGKGKGRIQRRVKSQLCVKEKFPLFFSPPLFLCSFHFTQATSVSGLSLPHLDSSPPPTSLSSLSVLPVPFKPVFCLIVRHHIASRLIQQQRSFAPHCRTL